LWADGVQAVYGIVAEQIFITPKLQQCPQRLKRLHVHGPVDRRHQVQVANVARDYEVWMEGKRVLQLLQPIRPRSLPSADR
jgi:hypothetical protein